MTGHLQIPIRNKHFRSLHFDRNCLQAKEFNLLVNKFILPTLIFGQVMAKKRIQLQQRFLHFQHKTPCTIQMILREIDFSSPGQSLTCSSENSILYNANWKALQWMKAGYGQGQIAFQAIHPQKTRLRYMMAELVT